MCTHSWNDKGHSPRPCPLVSSSAAGSYEAQSKVNTVQQFRRHPRCIVYSLSSALTSVRRTALCWDAMLPRPEQACGSSVILCSPSCSASLSERFAPLWEYKIFLRSLHAAFTSALPHTTLWLQDTIDTAHWQEPYFNSSSLMSSNLHMLGNRSCISFLTPRLMPTGTTFRLLFVGNKSVCVSVTFENQKVEEIYQLEAHQCVYFEHTSLNCQVTSCHHLNRNI